MTKKAGIIGAGIGGLATAIRLAIKGFQVDIYETNSTAGGKIAEFTKDGFRWDMGPSLFTLPELVDELFILAGKDSKDYLRYHKLDLLTKYFYEDGTQVNAWADPIKFAQEIENKTEDNAEKVKKYLAKSRKKYQLTNRVFLQSSLHKLGTYISPDALKAYLQTHKLEAFRTLHRANAIAFQDEKTVQYFDRFATYNGSDPYQAPATLGIIPHLEHNLGAFYPEGGMFSIVKALLQLADELEIKIHYNSPVEKIITENGKAKALQISEQQIDYDIIVSNADVWATYRKLLPQEKAPEKQLNTERSSSALIFYWAIDETFANLDLHNIFFSGNYMKEQYAIFKQKTLYDDPTVYAYISCKENTSDAPKGKENWFVMINVPPNTGQDWDHIISEARSNIIRKLNRSLGINLHNIILSERVADPRYIEEKMSSYQGALYGSSSNSKFAAFLRHPNFSSSLKNLYFCGGSVHPGGGIPLCLLSAKIVSDLVK
ncbi:MAG: phytoene desaturase [Sphingobacteriales bacterium]|nr:MAG: phytoene desaturase [Sphingobacteriales bacterium]